MDKEKVHSISNTNSSERITSTVFDTTYYLILSSNFPASFWLEAMASVCHIRNRGLTKSKKMTTLYEKLRLGYLQNSYTKSFLF